MISFFITIFWDEILSQSDITIFDDNTIFDDSQGAEVFINYLFNTSSLGNKWISLNADCKVRINNAWYNITDVFQYNNGTWQSIM